jgi:hypothetical protein
VTRVIQAHPDLQVPQAYEVSFNPYVVTVGMFRKAFESLPYWQFFMMAHAEPDPLKNCFGPLELHVQL